MEILFPQNLEKKWEKKIETRSQSKTTRISREIFVILTHLEYFGIFEAKRIFNNLIIQMMYYKNRLNLPSSIQTDDDYGDMIKKMSGEGVAIRDLDKLRFNVAAHFLTSKEADFYNSIKNGYKGIVQKQWSAARFIKMNFFFKNSYTLEIAPKDLTIVDRWFLHLLNVKIEWVQRNFLQGRLELITQNLYQLFAKDFCKWFLEFNKSQTKSTALTVNKIFESLLLLMNVFLPYSSEEIYSIFNPSDKKLLLEKTNSEFCGGWIFSKEFQQIETLRGIIKATRSLIMKSRVIGVKNKLILIQSSIQKEGNFLANNLMYLKSFIKCGEIKIVKSSRRSGFIGKINEMEIKICFEDENDKNKHLEAIEREFDYRNKIMDDANKNKNLCLTAEEKIIQRRIISKNNFRIKEIIKIKNEIV